MILGKFGMMNKISNRKYIWLNILSGTTPIVIGIMIYFEYMANMEIIIGISTILIIYGYGIIDIIIKIKKNKHMVDTKIKCALLAIWGIPTTITMLIALFIMIMILMFGRDIYEPGHITYVNIIYAIMITICKYKIIKQLMLD